MRIKSLKKEVSFGKHVIKDRNNYKKVGWGWLFLIAGCRESSCDKQVGEQKVVVLGVHANAQ